MPQQKPSPSELQEKLERWLEKKIPGADSIRVSNLEQPGMGLSSETYLFDLSYQASGGEIATGMVLRSAPPDAKVFPEYQLSHQFRIMRALENTAVPVAKMRWMEEDASVIGAPFFIMERLYGEVPQDFPSYHSSGIFFDASPEQRAKMWWGPLEAMAQLHKLDWKALGLSFLGVPGGGTDAIDRQLRYWENYFEWVKEKPDDPHPTLEASIAWMKANRYEPERVSLCWGDARMGNALYGPEHREVLAIMDWEMAFLGDPTADLAWYMLLDWQHSAGAGLERCAGTPSYEETVERYQELTGWKVRREVLLFNEVFSAVRYGMILIAVYLKFKELGISLLDEDMVHNNVCTQRLAELLDLPSPGPKMHESARIEDSKVTLQFHFTGEDSSDWYIVSDKGEASRHDGVIDNPSCVVTVSTGDWRAMRSGELDRMEAWTSGRLAIEGDLNVMIQLEDTISRLAD